MPVEKNNKSPIKPPRVRQFGGSFLILLTVLLLLNFIVPSFFGPRSPQVAYSDFITAVEAGKVNKQLLEAIALNIQFRRKRQMVR
jgi:cell division protease FtsH